MICVVNCYGQPTQPQQLARAAQSSSAGSTKDAQFVACRGRKRGCRGACLAGGRGRAVMLCHAGTVTHFSSYTNYFPHLIATHLHLLTQLTCISPLTPSRAMLRPARHSRIRRTARTHQDHRFSFLLCCHHAIGSLVFPSSVQP